MTYMNDTMAKQIIVSSL